MSHPEHTSTDKPRSRKQEKQEKQEKQDRPEKANVDEKPQEKKSSSRRKKEEESEEEESETSSSEYSEDSDDESVVDLSSDRLYQVLSAVLETDRGHNVAEILYRLQKDVHLLATSVNQLIQLSLAAQASRTRGQSDDEQ